MTKHEFFTYCSNILRKHSLSTREFSNTLGKLSVLRDNHSNTLLKHSRCLPKHSVTVHLAFILPVRTEKRSVHFRMQGHIFRNSF